MRFTNLRESKRLVSKAPKFHNVLNTLSLARNSFTQPISFFLEFLIRYLEMNRVRLLWELIAGCFVPILRFVVLTTVMVLFHVQNLTTVTYWSPRAVTANIDLLSAGPLLTKSEFDYFVRSLLREVDRAPSVQILTSRINKSMRDQFKEQYDKKKSQILTDLVFQTYYGYALNKYSNQDSVFKEFNVKELITAYDSSLKPYGRSYLGFDAADLNYLRNYYCKDPQEGGFGVTAILYYYCTSVFIPCLFEKKGTLTKERAYFYFNRGFLGCLGLIYFIIFYFEYQIFESIFTSWGRCSTPSLLTLFENLFEVLCLVGTTSTLAALTVDLYRYRLNLCMQLLKKEGYLKIKRKSEGLFRFEYQKANFSQKLVHIMRESVLGPTKYLKLVKRALKGQKVQRGLFELRLTQNPQELVNPINLMVSVVNALLSNYVLLDYIINGQSRVYEAYNKLSSTFYSDKCYRAKGYSGFWYDLNLVLIVGISQYMKTVPSQIVHSLMDPLTYHPIAYYPFFYIFGPLVFLTLKRRYALSSLQCLSLVYVLLMVITFCYFLALPAMRESFRYNPHYALDYELEFGSRVHLLNRLYFKVRDLDVVRQTLLQVALDHAFDTLPPYSNNPLVSGDIYGLMKLV